MINLFWSGDYNWALFLGHLVIEKLLKALYVKRRETYAIREEDFSHLNPLAEEIMQSGIELI